MSTSEGRPVFLQWGRIWAIVKRCCGTPSRGDTMQEVVQETDKLYLFTPSIGYFKKPNTTSHISPSKIQFKLKLMQSVQISRNIIIDCCIFLAI